MYTDKELYSLLEDSGYKTTEENLKTLKEGLDSGKYEIFDMEEIFAEMVIADNYEADYLCEFFGNNNLNDKDLDVIEEMFDTFDKDESTLNEGFKEWRERRKIRKQHEEEDASKKGDADNVYRSTVTTSKDKYNEAKTKIKTGYKTFKKENIKRAKEAWTSLTPEQQREKKEAYKQAKKAYKSAKRFKPTFQKADDGSYGYKGADGVMYKTKSEADAAGKKHLQTLRDTRDTAKKEKKEFSKRGFVKKAKADFKGQRDQQLQKAKETYTSEVKTAETTRQGAHNAVDQARAESDKAEAEARRLAAEKEAQEKKEAAQKERQATTQAASDAGYKFTHESYYSDYELYQFLENSGYKTTVSNLEVLKEGLESGKYVIDFDLGYSDYELYQVLENSGYETTAENLAVLKEGLVAGDYDIIVE
jgi:chemotaxis protein histidine kinase CheA